MKSKTVATALDAIFTIKYVRNVTLVSANTFPDSRDNSVPTLICEKSMGHKYRHGLRRVLSFPALVHQRDDRSLLFTTCVHLFLIATLLGCGKSLHQPASAKGTVTFRGEPIQKGVIRFLVEEGTPGPGGLSAIEEGRYEIPSTSGFKSGTYVVSIYGFQKTGRIIKVDNSTPPEEEEKQFIPRQYNDESTQFHQILPGDNTLDFDLK